MYMVLKLRFQPRGKRQLSRYEVDATGPLARVRIHVERLIGVIWQKYSILEAMLLINMLMCHEEEEQSIIDKMACLLLQDLSTESATLLRWARAFLLLSLVKDHSTFSSA